MLDLELFLRDIWDFRFHFSSDAALVTGKGAWGVGGKLPVVN